jgi:hypothetical protein
MMEPASKLDATIYTSCCHDPFESFGVIFRHNHEEHEQTSTVSEADVLLAKEMNQLSVNERQLALEEVHGVATDINDPPDLVAQSLEQMEKEIKAIRKRTLYDRALFLNPKLVKDEKFRLMFLRAEYFDARRAAKRIVLHFEYKKELWGESRLVKTITLDDLDEDDMDCLRSHPFQPPGAKDRAGRAIFFCGQKYSRYNSWKNLVSSLY